MDDGNVHRQREDQQGETDARPSLLEKVAEAFAVVRWLPISRRPTPPRVSPRLPISEQPTPRLPVHNMTTQRLSVHNMTTQ